MSNEAQVMGSLFVRKNDADDGTVLLNEQFTTAFQADVDGTLGPTPGAFTASEYGTDVDLSELTTPGLCWLSIQNADNYVTFGISDPDTDEFYPLGELLPGERYPIRLSRSLGEVWTASGTGTGTSGSSNKTLTFYAHGGDTVVYVGAFEK